MRGSFLRSLKFENVPSSLLQNAATHRSAFTNKYSLSVEAASTEQSLLAATRLVSRCRYSLGILCSMFHLLISLAAPAFDDYEIADPVDVLALLAKTSFFEGIVSEPQHRIHLQLYPHPCASPLLPLCNASYSGCPA